VSRMSNEKVQGLLIDYEWCTGCHACEIACKQINELRHDQWGIVVNQLIQRRNDKTVIDFMPIPTDLCNLCAPLTAQGKSPSCVHHCPPKVIEFGPIDELVERQKRKPKQALWTPRASGLQKK